MASASIWSAVLGVASALFGGAVGGNGEADASGSDTATEAGAAGAGRSPATTAAGAALLAPSGRPSSARSSSSASTASEGGLTGKVPPMTAANEANQSSLPGSASGEVTAGALSLEARGPVVLRVGLGTAGGGGATEEMATSGSNGEPGPAGVSRSSSNNSSAGVSQASNKLAVRAASPGGVADRRMREPEFSTSKAVPQAPQTMRSGAASWCWTLRRPAVRHTGQAPLPDHSSGR